MTKPELFIINTDYGTLKMGEKQTVTLSIPGSMTVGSNQEWINSTVISAPTNASNPTSQVRNGRNNIWYATNKISFTRTGSQGPYSLSCSIIRTSPNQLTISVRIFNGSPSSMTTQSGNETIYFEITNMVPPFS